MKHGWKKLITLVLALTLALSVLPAQLPVHAEEESAEVYGIVLADGLRVRKQPSTSSVYWFKVDTNFVFEILDVMTKSGTDWYKINTDHPEDNGRTYIGYVQASFVRILDADEVALWKAGKLTGSNAAPENTDPADNTTEAPAGALAGYLRFTANGVNLRVAPAGSVGLRVDMKGEIMPYYGSPVKESGYTWYNVQYQGQNYYVRSDCVVTVTADGTEVTAPPAVTPAPSDGSTTVGYVRTIKSGVNLRLKAGGEVITQVPKQVVVPCMAASFKEGGYTWYYVQYNGLRGYLRGDCVVVCTEDGTEIGSGESGVVETTPVPTYYGYLIMTKQGVNLRAKPAGSSMEQLDKGVIVPVVGEPVDSSKYTWYPVITASGKSGYVRSDCVAICNQDGSTEGAILAPGAATPEPTPETSKGYIMLTKGGVNLRKTMGGSTLTQLSKGTVWPLTGDPQIQNNVTWYPVKANGYNGYVRGDCAFKLSAAQEESYLNGNGVPDEDDPSVAPAVTYLKLIKDSVNLRSAASQDATSKYKVDSGLVLAYNATTTSGGYTWYRVIYNNQELWARGDCVSTITQAEYEEYVKENPGSTPQPEVAVGYVRTNIDDLNLRESEGGSVITRVSKGLVLPYLKAPTTVRGYTWYYVKLADGTRGYLRGDLVVRCESDGTEISGSTGIEPGSEATYTTLKVGSTGEAVKNLVIELRAQGYYSGSVTSTYTTDVRDAVKAFQEANSLKVDGIAGPATQHALFGTIPEGSGTGDLTMTIYPAEKIDWDTGGIQKLWPKGANFKVYDVKTGIVWWAHRWSGADHCDVETLTAADTARLCKIYGVSKASDITDKNGHWRRRPCLVTIGERTFACSLYGVPHNEDGDTIDDNEMIGQICIHFTNSRIHRTDVVDEGHQEAIEYAWKNAPNGYLPYDGD